MLLLLYYAPDTQAVHPAITGLTPSILPEGPNPEIMGINLTSWYIGIVLLQGVENPHVSVEEVVFWLSCVIVPIDDPGAGLYKLTHNW
jgi:hypothetical protein